MFASTASLKSIGRHHGTLLQQNLGKPSGATSAFKNVLAGQLTPQTIPYTAPHPVASDSRLRIGVQLGEAIALPLFAEMVRVSTARYKPRYAVANLEGVPPRAGKGIGLLIKRFTVLRAHPRRPRGHCKSISTHIMRQGSHFFAPTS